MTAKLDSISRAQAVTQLSFVKKEQVRLLYMQALVSNCAIITISILYYFLLRPRLNSNLLLIWMLSLLAFSSYRLYLWYSQKNRPKTRSAATWLNLYLIGCGLLGIAWSLIYPCLINSIDPIVLASLLILAFGIMSSAIPILSAYIPAFILYTYPQGISLFSTLIHMEDDTYSWLALAVAIYLLTITLFVKNTNKSILQSINLQQQNHSLINDLTLEMNQRETLIAKRTLELKRKNEDLISEIKVRKNAEEELRNSETKYRELINSSPDLRYRTDSEGRIVFISPSVRKISGYTVEEVAGMKMEELYVNPEERKNVLTLLQKYGFVSEYEAQLKRKDGSIWWASTNAHLFKNNDGHILGVEGVTRDVTERKKVEEVLRETKDRLATFMDSATDGFILFDSDFYHLEMNKAALEITGLKRKDVIGRKLVDVLPDIKGTSRYDAYKKVIDTGVPYQIVDLTNHPLTGEKHIELKAFKVGEGLGVIFTDITGRKQAEEEKFNLETQLQQAQKMESIGTLAGGIAHEFNNILAIIMGNNQLIMEEVPQGSLVFESAEEIQIAGIRARDVVKQLLTFSRQDDVIKKVLDFKLVVQESIKLIRSSTPVNIKIEQNLSAYAYLVMGNDTQINQLLINLCNNAVDALPENGGVITIELLNETIGKQQINHPTKLDAGQYAKLVVSDNGIGMDTEILNRIFEPYYTTKKFGEGTGIGLAIVHGIIEKHGGAIMADSKPGRGTTFTILLPAHEGLLEQETEERDILPVGNENILYVDDEPSIAMLGKRLLESLGYTTESITNPEEALDLVRSDPNKFDLLITDMAMPNMQGDQLVIEILKIRQDMPAIICTGYSARISEKDAIDIGVHSFIMKPIIKSELAKIVRNVLDCAKRSYLVKL
jgi:PAS domain S-box-containing protein